MTVVYSLLIALNVELLDLFSCPRQRNWQKAGTCCLWVGFAYQVSCHDSCVQPLIAVKEGNVFIKDALNLIAVNVELLDLFSCPGQRNQRRPVPVPVTGVRYNSLL